MLEYEEVLTREIPSPHKSNKTHFNAGAHFVWIGDRTRQLTGAHVEYFRGLYNPIGVKGRPQSQHPFQFADVCSWAHHVCR